MATTTTPAPAAAKVDTGKVTDRRKLRFDTPEQMWADVQRIAAAERAGTLRRSGNWTPGQIFGHLATFINFAYDGYPSKPPFFVKALLRPFRTRFIRQGLPPGKSIPGVEGGTWGSEPLALDAGIAKLDSAWKRLKAAAPTAPNPIFGPMTHEEWQQMHLRHAELHLSFLHPA